MIRATALSSTAVLFESLNQKRYYYFPQESISLNRKLVIEPRYFFKKAHSTFFELMFSFYMQSLDKIHLTKSKIRTIVSF